MADVRLGNKAEMLIASQNVCFWPKAENMSWTIAPQSNRLKIGFFINSCIAWKPGGCNV